MNRIFLMIFCGALALCFNPSSWSLADDETSTEAPASDSEFEELTEQATNLLPDSSSHKTGMTSPQGFHEGTTPNPGTHTLEADSDAATQALTTE